jgi:hypothetical protein
MAVKGADLVHAGNTVLIERAQNAGPGQVNINTEKIYELGNYKSVASIRDTPDLTFTVESLDASAAIEAMLVNTGFGALAAGSSIDLSKAVPLDVVSSFKNGYASATPYDVLGAVGMPYLTLESMSYRFGIADKATQTATLRGDSIFYMPGSGYVQEATGTAAANQTVVLANPAYPYAGDVSSGTRYALSVSLASGKRLLYGTDYTEAAVGAGVAKNVTLTILAAVPITDKIRVSYASSTVANYPQGSHTVASATRPAAIKGRDIKVYIGGTAIANRWTAIQSVNVDWRVTLDKDEEFGNYQVVAQDFDVPEVSGGIDLKPRDYTDLVKRVRQIAGVSTATEVAGPVTSAPLELMIELRSPTDGTVLKTLYVPDARFTLPGYSGRVQQKLTTTFNWESDSGALLVYKGAKP